MSNQPEFWKTVQDPSLTSYPTPTQHYLDLPNMSIINSNDRPWNRYYARKVVNVSFAETVGKQTLTYDLTDIYDYLFTLYIADQPDEGTIMVCKWINGQLYAFGSEGRNDGGYS